MCGAPIGFAVVGECGLHRLPVHLAGRHVGGGVLRNGGQTFSAGFSIFTLAYLVLVFGPWFSGHVKDHLLTSRLLRYGYQQLTPADTSLGIALDDWDDDGLADLYFADDARLNNMYRNLGDGRFVDVSESFDMGTNLADFDDDGDLDLYVTNFELTAGRSWRNFERIGHSLFALLIGLVGGVLARSMRRAVYGTSRQPRRD